MATAAETTIDKSYDQTAEHIHAGDKACPTCGGDECGVKGTLQEPAGPDSFGGEDFPYQEPETPSLQPPFDRPVSPAVLEMRILQLTEAKQDWQDRAIAAEKRADAAELRIRQFEILAHSLAVEVDRCKTTLEKIDAGLSVARLAA